ncbi:DUF4367 domain-containing protein [Oceanobacillus salinisoli]|uniref:DUF4367 domain-containing protein n=1 Tax=Oceanobacillus salinisoli TaxID=2678611 RepID=UPI0012E253D0|nr:DUF4367 domain-containing protein [Oceanobacillus salinisoli]
MNNDEFDQLFDKAFEKAVTNSDDITSDHQPSWKKVKKRIKTEQKKRAMKRNFRRISVIAASMLLGAIIFGNSNVSNAFNPFYITLKEMPGQIVNIFAGNNDTNDDEAKTPPPTNGENSQNQGDLNVGETGVSVTLEEAKEQVSFNLPAFDYIPNGYTLKETVVFRLPEEDLAKKVRFTFIDQNKETFWVTLTQLESNTTIGSGANADVEEVQLKSGKGYLSLSPDQSSKLEFLQGNVYVTILGTLSKEDIIRFAENI